MCSQCINSTFDLKSVIGNGFSNTDFLQDGEILAVWRSFSPIMAIFHGACAVSTKLLPV